MQGVDAARSGFGGLAFENRLAKLLFVPSDASEAKRKVFAPKHLDLLAHTPILVLDYSPSDRTIRCLCLDKANRLSAINRSKSHPGLDLQVCSKLRCVPLGF
ncbi:hypothetical protein Rhopal_003013-T1 [Rhodotorula paludigena]|uniref:Uncharacterized protein n=1 Tax=Rhodotorula paludigena TaxID=86838 RepID=A0AAV5GIJ4_9BASI|nr:hypothetical protein Rhopal_003013-T1 [Rhodotorula paludigena]